jgi:hypothetical protein
MEVPTLEYNKNGNDGYLKQELLHQYQQALNSAAQNAKAIGEKGIGGSKNVDYATRLGNFIDRSARDMLKSRLNDEGIKFGPKEHVSVNNRDYNINEKDYRIPDVRVGNMILDGTIANKKWSTPQIQGYLKNRPSAVVYAMKPEGYNNYRTIVYGPKADSTAKPTAVTPSVRARVRVKAR